MRQNGIVASQGKKAVDYAGFQTRFGLDGETVPVKHLS